MEEGEQTKCSKDTNKMKILSASRASDDIISFAKINVRLRNRILLPFMRLARPD